MTTSRVKKKTIVVHLNGAFTPMTNRELWYLRSHETEKRYTNLLKNSEIYEASKDWT